MVVQAPILSHLGAKDLIIQLVFNLALLTLFLRVQGEGPRTWMASAICIFLFLIKSEVTLMV
jgi:hypothetical protein